MQDWKQKTRDYLKTIYKPKIADTFKNYNLTLFKSDLMAGFIVAIIALPLALAFGIASGVTPQEGLITAIIGGFIVAALGGSNFQVSGPTGAFIVVVYGIISSFGTTGIIVATFIAGIMLVIMGFLKFGSLIRFIPYPLIVGFTSGIAVIIFSSQIKDFLGLQIAELPGDFLSNWMAYGQAITTIKPWTLGISALSLGIIILWPKFTKKIPASLMTIIIMTILVYLLRHYANITEIETVGDRFTISAQLPKPEKLPLNLQTFRLLLPSAFTIAMLSAIESLLSATVADGATGDKHDSNTELIAQGAANIVVPFFGGIPVTGAIARTVSNINSGAKTPIAAIIHAFILLIIFLFLSPLASYIPMATLAAILIMVAYQMSQWRTFISLLKHPKSDIAVLLSTFLLTVIADLTIAIEIGMLVSILLFIKRVAETTDISIVKNKLANSESNELHPDLKNLDIPDGIEIYEIEGPFFFGIASKFDEVMKTLSTPPKVRIIRMRAVPFMDSTGINNLQSLFELSQRQQFTLILSGVNNRVEKTLEQSGLKEKIGAHNIFPDIQKSLEYAKSIISSNTPTNS